MEMELQESQENPLLGREEHTVLIEHQGEATPSEDKVRKKFAAEHDKDPKTIRVNHIYTGFGSTTSKAQLRSYDEQVVEEEAEDESETDEEDDAADEATEEQDDETGEDEEEATGDEAADDDTDDEEDDA